MKFKHWTTVAIAAIALTLPLTAQDTSAPGRIWPGQMKARIGSSPPQLSPEQLQSLRIGAMKKKQPTLPLWYYGLIAPRDGNPYTGVVVGNEPGNSNSGEADIPTQIVPLIVLTHRIVTSINPDGTLNTVPGDTYFDPTVADSSCLAPPNDVPLTLTEQSPVFKSANFTMGGTNVGTTQYGDAFQRANFWNVIKRNKYHVLLNPVITLRAIVLDIPGKSGVAVPPELTGGICGSIGGIDFDVLDPIIDQQILPALYRHGVNSSTLPIFLMYNAFITFGTPEPNNCCFLSVVGYNNLQSYLYAAFHNTHVFGTSDDDAWALSAAVGAWMNGPHGNYAPSGSCRTSARLLKLLLR